jgi:SET domain-containing protein
MKNTTDRESFILKPSTVPGGGIGVFALHDIAEGTHMAVFLPDFEEEIRNSEDVPEELQGFCLTQEDGTILCPKYFNSMDIGNYLNHSKTANLRYEKGKGYFAKRDIHAGEELLANYNELGEPEEGREDYYE